MDPKTKLKMQDNTDYQSSGRIINIDDIIYEWAKKWFKEKEKHDLEKRYGKLQWECLRKELDLSKLRMHPNDSLKYEDEHRFTPQSSGKHILFKSTFINSTQNTQEYSFRTERKTKSVCSMNITEGFQSGKGFELKVALPHEVLEANVGFNREISFSESMEKTLEDELTWSVDSVIKVPSGYKTIAELHVKEEEYKGTFNLTSTFSGYGVVKIYKDNLELTEIRANNLPEIFTQKLGFQHNQPGKVSMVTQGVCHCKYGIEQRVKLIEKKLSTVDSDAAS